MNIKEIVNSEIKNYLSETYNFDIMKNTEKAQNFGSTYGQDVEPKGTYVLKGKTTLPGWLNGKASLNNPLFVNIDDNNTINYKRELSDKYKAKGTNLTNKLMKAGYDSLITVLQNGDYGEIVLFPNSKFMLG